MQKRSATPKCREKTKANQENEVLKQLGSKHCEHWKTKGKEKARKGNKKESLWKEAHLILLEYLVEKVENDRELEVKDLKIKNR